MGDRGRRRREDRRSKFVETRTPSTVARSSGARRVPSREKRCFYSLSLLFSLRPSIPIDQCALRRKFVAKRKTKKKMKESTKGKKVEEKDWTKRLREKVLVRRREKEGEIGGGKRETKERDDKYGKTKDRK